MFLSALPCLALPCLALPCLDVVIKDYYLSLCPRLRVLVPPCCVHHDRRPDLNSKRRPFTSFCFVRFLKSFYFCSCLSVSQQISHHLSFRPSPRKVGDILRSWEISAASRSPSPQFAGDDAAVRGLPSPPFVGDHTAVRGSPRPAVRGRSLRRPPLTQAPWIQSTSSGQECRVCLVVPTGTF